MQPRTIYVDQVETFLTQSTINLPRLSPHIQPKSQKVGRALAAGAIRPARNVSHGNVARSKLVYQRPIAGNKNMRCPSTVRHGVHNIQQHPLATAHLAELIKK